MAQQLKENRAARQGVGEPAAPLLSSTSCERTVDKGAPFPEGSKSFRQRGRPFCILFHGHLAGG